jgi:hypothetical protein
MEPEKPKGHIRGIWAITIIVALAMIIGGVIWYLVIKNNVPETNVSLTQVSPSTSPSTSASTSASPSTSGSSETASWKTYTSEFMSFKYPTDWQIEQKELWGGSVYEDLDLGIPEQAESSIGYSGAPYSGVLSGMEKASPGKTILSEKDVTVSGIKGKKVITTFDNSVNISYSYDIAVPVSAGTFAIHLNMAKDTTKNNSIANKLDTLLTTIEIKKK